MDRMTVMIGISILLLSIFPFVSANPMPMSTWEDAQAGGSPEPQLKNTNVTFFKEIVKADIDGEKVKVHADYWFRNEGGQNETIKILLPLSKDPRDIDLKADDRQTDWYRMLYSDRNGYDDTLYEAIAFEIILFTFSKEVKVTVEFWDDLSKYDSNLNNYIGYFYSYLVGSARAWNRSLEKADFEIRVPVSMFDRGDYGSWDRDRDGSDYVFTKGYSDWLPDNSSEKVSLNWEMDRSILSWKIIRIENGPDITVGTVLLILAIAAIIIIVIVLHNKRKKHIAP